jgi:NhaA family Na+:H+ antiporter
MTILRTMRNFSSMNIAASILLFVAAIAAAIIANSPVAPVYQEFLLHELHLQIVILICFRMAERICG